MPLWQILFLLLLLLMAAAVAAIIVWARRSGPPAAPQVTAPASISGKIRVEMIDANTTHVFRAAHYAPDDLPQSFEAATTIHLEAGDFEVIEATPMTAVEFRRTGHLRLVVRERKMAKLGSIDKLLFSLATISDDPPAIAPGTSKLETRIVELHEDDWRQVEFVATSRQEQIDAELAGVRLIYEEQRTAEGYFRALHVREGLPAPLAGTEITLAKLITSFDPPPQQLDGIAYRGVAGLVVNGFALRLLSGIELLGVVDDAGHVATLCLSHARRASRRRTGFACSTGIAPSSSRRRNPPSARTSKPRDRSFTFSTTKLDISLLRSGVAEAL